MNRLAQMPFAALLSALVATSTGAQVVNEGTGSRRASLDEMIFEPAPTAEILGADEWIGAAPTLADISGRPVVVFTWAEWYRPSHAVAMLSKRLGEEFEDLVVIGVHDAEGWDQAKSFAEQRKLGFPIVRDADGSIRRTLRVDQDPDVYVFDRAGQVRYADITTESLRAAVEEVVGEDTGSAAGIEDRLASERAEAARQRRLARGINEGVGFEQQINVPFTKPSPEEYAAVEWPERELTAEERRRNRRGDEGGPVPWSPPAEGWFRDRKPNTEGRILVVYTWHPANRSSMDDLMNRMDGVQQRLSRDVVVIGVLGPLADDRRRNEEPDPIRDLPATTETIETYVGNRSLSHYLVAMPEGVNIPVGDNSRRRGGGTPINAVMLVSTDGNARRAEFASNWEALRRAMDTMLRVDPGVKARRAAEDQFIRGSGG